MSFMPWALAIAKSPRQETPAAAISAESAVASRSRTGNTAILAVLTGEAPVLQVLALAWVPVLIYRRRIQMPVSEPARGRSVVKTLKSQIATSNLAIPPERIERAILLIRGQKVM